MVIKTNGANRIVFLVKDYAIKIPKPNTWYSFLKGLISNINEKNVYRYNSGNYENGRSHLLCPVLWCSWGGWVLIMKRAKLLTEKEWIGDNNTIEEHIKYFAGDDTISNYGLINGRLVKIDYADIYCS